MTIEKRAIEKTTNLEASQGREHNQEAAENYSLFRASS
jgi:hypothetical protein